MSKPRTPVKSLDQPDRSGFLTKQGGKFKTWKRRWFVLKGNKLYYFKTQNDSDVTGVIELTNKSFVKKEERLKGKQNGFSVSSTNRVYLMYSDNTPDQEEWIEEIQKTLDKLIVNGKTVVNIIEPTKSNDDKKGSKIGNQVEISPSGSPVRDKLNAARKTISFLEEEDSKVLEFWQIWADSLPPLSTLDSGSISYDISVSVDMDKLSWRTAGPQHIYIQRMVDFFWNVGAPETEIDRLNDVGALINPTSIGSWIDMSGKGGMDGGWYFPGEIPMTFALQAADPGEPLNRLEQWVKENHVEQCTVVGRDMGAAPPRQTELRFYVPGNSFSEQIDLVLSAWENLDFPRFADDMLEVIRMSNSRNNVLMSVITSAENFVKFGIFIPKPTKEVVERCFTMRQVEGMDRLNSLEHSIGSQGPDFVEFQYLQQGFGYGVYTEGFDVVFHFKVGEEYSTSC